MLTRIDTDEIDADSDSITGDEGVGVKSIELPDEEETCSCSSDGGLADCMLDETAFVLEVAKISAKNELWSVAKVVCVDGEEIVVEALAFNCRIKWCLP